MTTTDLSINVLEVTDKIGDHQMIDVSLEVQDPNIRTQHKQVLDYKRANFELMKKELGSYNYEVLMNNKNAEECYMILKDKIATATDHHIPRKAPAQPWPASCGRQRLTYDFRSTESPFDLEAGQGLQHDPRCSTKDLNELLKTHFKVYKSRNINDRNLERTASLSTPTLEVRRSPEVSSRTRLPCTTRWNSLHDALTLLLKHREKLNELFTALELPTLKTSEIEFIDEYICVLAPIATAIDHLQGEEAIFYGHFLPTLVTVQNKLNELKSNQLEYCVPLLQAVFQGFQKRFKKNHQLVDEPDVHDAILAATTHPYFKLRWVDVNKAWDRKSKISATTFQSENSAGASEEANSLSSEDEYFGFEKKS
ncbi:Ribonuclease H-like domain [Trinorchestia longiramus]|nr:Ribonuclease H-like domain [Trinorchestia longiramus]